MSHRTQVMRQTQKKRSTRHTLPDMSLAHVIWLQIVSTATFQIWTVTTNMSVLEKWISLCFKHIPCSYIFLNIVQYQAHQHYACMIINFLVVMPFYFASADVTIMFVCDQMDYHIFQENYSGKTSQIYKINVKQELKWLYKTHANMFWPLLFSIDSWKFKRS